MSITERMPSNAEDGFDDIEASSDSEGPERLRHPANADNQDISSPPFLLPQRSRGSLLDCSDTDSDDEEQSAQASAQKSAEWEKLQAAWAAQQQAMPHSASEPPRPFKNGKMSSQQQQHHHQQHQSIPRSIAATTFDRDVSGYHVDDDDDHYRDGRSQPSPGYYPYYQHEPPPQYSYPYQASQGRSPHVVPTASYSTHKADYTAMPPPPPPARKGTDEEELWRRRQAAENDLEDYRLLQMVNNLSETDSIEGDN